MNDMREINAEMGFLNSILLLGPLALLVMLGCGVSVILAAIPSKWRSVQIGRIVLECVALGFCVFYLWVIIYVLSPSGDEYWVWRLQGLINYELTIVGCVGLSRVILAIKQRRERHSEKLHS